MYLFSHFHQTYYSLYYTPASSMIFTHWLFYKFFVSTSRKTEKAVVDRISNYLRNYSILSVYVLTKELWHTLTMSQVYKTLKIQILFVGVHHDLTVTFVCTWPGLTATHSTSGHERRMGRRLLLFLCYSSKLKSPLLLLYNFFWQSQTYLPLSLF